MSQQETARSIPLRVFLILCGLVGPRSLEGGILPLAPSMPLVDVRSPAEFLQGHMPGAVNIPLFSDDERAEVGTVYKRGGREKAVLRGLAFAGPKLPSFVERALCLLPEKPVDESDDEARCLAIYCSRGGMRSASISWLLALYGIRVYVLDCGYKGFRQYVLSFLEKAHPLRVLGGKTGCGKTEVLRMLAHQGVPVLDLEHMARHRGSAFGDFSGEEQPSREHFENRLATALGQCEGEKFIWVEDESENLGRVNLPGFFFRQLRQAPIVKLRVPEEERLDRVLSEYGMMPRHHMGERLDRIKKRLGGQAHKEAHECLQKEDLASLAGILLRYYDKAYDRQLEGRDVTAVINALGATDAAQQLFLYR